MNNRKKQICSFLTSGLLFSFSSFAYVNGMENQNNQYSRERNYNFLDKLKEINDDDYGDLSSDNYDIFNVLSIENRNYDPSVFYDKSPEKTPMFVEAEKQTDNPGASINQYASDPKNFSGEDPEKSKEVFELIFCIINHQYNVAVRVPGREYPSLYNELEKIVCPRVAYYKFKSICNLIENSRIATRLGDLRLIYRGLCDTKDERFSTEDKLKYPTIFEVYQFLRNNRTSTNTPQSPVDLDQQTINSFFEVQKQINSVIFNIAQVLSAYYKDLTRRILCDGEIFLNYFGNRFPLVGRQPMVENQSVPVNSFKSPINPSSPIDHRFNTRKRERNSSSNSTNNKETDEEFTIKNKKLDSNSNFTMHTRSMDRNFKKNQ